MPRLTDTRACAELCYLLLKPRQGRISLANNPFLLSPLVRRCISVTTYAYVKPARDGFATVAIRIATVA